MKKRSFTKKDFLKNRTSNFVLGELTYFPEHAIEGQMFWHSSLNDAFICINGKPSDTTLKGNWKPIITLEGIDLLSTGQPIDKFLITDGNDGFVYGDIDGGEL